MRQGPTVDLESPRGLRLVGREEDGSLSAEMALGDEHRRPGGGVHLGVYAAVAETLCLAGTRAGAAGAVEVLSCHLSRFASLDAGPLRFRARPRHRGRTTWVWEVDGTDQVGRPAAAARVTVAIRG